MIHDVYAQIAHLSTAFTLEPGDLLATGYTFGRGRRDESGNILA